MFKLQVLTSIGSHFFEIKKKKTSGSHHAENDRDLGESLDSLSQVEKSQWVFPKGVIFRGGEIGMQFGGSFFVRCVACFLILFAKICCVHCCPRSALISDSTDYCAPDALRNPKTIINLRMGSDNLDVPLFKEHGVKYVQLALPNSIEKYDTAQKVVRDWLQEILLTVQNLPAAEFPVMIHCRAGKDRTGIVIATLLAALGFPRDLISTPSFCPACFPLQTHATGLMQSKSSFSVPKL
jgi:hypothetical protein